MFGVVGVDERLARCRIFNLVADDGNAGAVRTEAPSKCPFWLPLLAGFTRASTAASAVLKDSWALAAETMTKTSSAAANEVRHAGPNCCSRADDAADRLLGEPGLGPLEMCAE